MSIEQWRELWNNQKVDSPHGICPYDHLSDNDTADLQSTIAEKMAAIDGDGHCSSVHASSVDALQKISTKVVSVFSVLVCRCFS